MSKPQLPHIHYKDAHGTELAWLSVDDDNDKDHDFLRSLGLSPCKVCESECADDDNV